jgi:hypothetical protein
MKGYNNFQNISYQSSLLKKIYKINTCPIDYLNLETYTLGRDAFILSLLYLSDHNSNLLTKVYFPRLIIPISAVLTSLVDYFISYVILVILL